MKETYLSRDFRETAAQSFPSQAKELNAFFDVRLNVLLAENADASKEKQYHLQRQILPGIAAYEALQRVMPKEEALQTVHGYVERLARTSHKQLATLLLIPELYRLVPGVFVKSTRSVFGPAAGFDSKELQVGNGIWRVDMMKCPYCDDWYVGDKIPVLEKLQESNADIRHNKRSNPRTGQAIGVGVAVAIEDLKANLTVQSRCFFIFPINLFYLSGHSSYTPGSEIHNRA